MIRSRAIFCLTSLALLVALIGCDTPVPGEAASQNGGSLDQAGTAASSQTSSREDDSVADVLAEGLSDVDSGQALPAGKMEAEVSNHSSERADVTIRFIKDDVVAHLAFASVSPMTSTIVTSPVAVSIVAFSGVTVGGTALANAELQFGVDFHDNQRALYTIEPATDEPVPGDDDDTTSPPGNDNPYLAPTLKLTEPASNVTLYLGEVLPVTWTDEAPMAGTVVVIGLRQLTAPGSFFALTPGISAQLDGLNDGISLVIQGMEAGEYEVVGRIDDGIQVLEAVAPGRVTVLADPLNVAPTIELLSPTSPVQLKNGEFLVTSWTDEDPDDNAIITFELRTTIAGFVNEIVSIGPAVAEDPDGAAFDQIALQISGVLPGLYDLVAIIDDGKVAGTSALPGVVDVLANPSNSPPSLELIEPAACVTVAPGEALTFSWIDTDSDNDATIAILLDPGMNGLELNGDEILLASSISEDPDGTADSISITLTEDLVPEGNYQVLGVISDGIVTVVSAAPGSVAFGAEILCTTTPGEVPTDEGNENAPVDDDEPLPIITIGFGEPGACVAEGNTVDVLLDILGLNGMSVDYVSMQLVTANTEGEPYRVDVTPPDLDLTASVVQIEIPDLPEDVIVRTFRIQIDIQLKGEVVTAVSDGVIGIPPAPAECAEADCGPEDGSYYQLPPSCIAEGEAAPPGSSGGDHDGPPVHDSDESEPLPPVDVLTGDPAESPPP